MPKADTFKFADYTFFIGGFHTLQIAMQEHTLSMVH